MFWFFGHEACGILAPWPGIEPAPPALEGEVLTTGPPGKSLYSAFKTHLSLATLLPLPLLSRIPSYMLCSSLYLSYLSALSHFIVIVCSLIFPLLDCGLLEDRDSAHTEKINASIMSLIYIKHQWKPIKLFCSHRLVSYFIVYALIIPWNKIWHIFFSTLFLKIFYLFIWLCWS